MLYKIRGMAPHHKRLILSCAILVLLAAYFLAFPPTAAKEYKGSSTLTGVVLGPDDKPVPRAVITYQSSAGMAPHVARSDSTGRFTIAKLAADNYDLRASAKGLFSEWEKNVSLRRGETKTLTLRLIYARGPVKPSSNKQKK